MIVSLEDLQVHQSASMCTPISDDSAEQQRITDVVTSITERRAVIEQAKGMLMLSYGIGPDAAFELLRGQSQRHNVKLRLLAEQIVKDLLALAESAPQDRRQKVDRVLQTVHKRVITGPAR